MVHYHVAAGGQPICGQPAPEAETTVHPHLVTCVGCRAVLRRLTTVCPSCTGTFPGGIADEVCRRCTIRERTLVNEVIRYLESV